uniref:Uncharacterized protein n=1 Tax=Anguilla anguilla TaxID=7936 RepID=A0A0E9XJ04_ANGAN
MMRIRVAVSASSATKTSNLLWIWPKAG